MSDFELMIKQAKPSTVWRAAAVLMLGICGVGTAVHFFSLDPRYVAQADQDIITLPVFMVFSGVTMLALLVLLLYPLQFYIYAGICAFWGLAYLIDGGGVYGCIMYLSGVYFARRQGFYTTGLTLKALGTALALIGAIGLQYRYGLSVMLTTVLDCVMVSFMGVLWRFVIPCGVPDRAAVPQAEPVHRTSDLRLWYRSEQDREILERICAGEKYDLIAKTLGLSVRSVNRRAKGLFMELGVKNRADFVHWYKASL